MPCTVAVHWEVPLGATVAGVHDTETELTLGDPGEDEEPLLLVPPQAVIAIRKEKATAANQGRLFKRLLLRIEMQALVERENEASFMLAGRRNSPQNDLPGRGGGLLIFLVRALEVLDHAAVEVPDAGRHFIDEVVVMRDQQDCALVLLE